MPEWTEASGTAPESLIQEEATRIAEVWWELFKKRIDREGCAKTLRYLSKVEAERREKNGESAAAPTRGWFGEIPPAQWWAENEGR